MSGSFSPSLECLAHQSLERVARERLVVRALSRTREELKYTRLARRRLLREEVAQLHEETGRSEQTCRESNRSEAKNASESKKNEPLRDSRRLSARRRAAASPRPKPARVPSPAQCRGAIRQSETHAPATDIIVGIRSKIALKKWYSHLVYNAKEYCKNEEKYNTLRTFGPETPCEIHSNASRNNAGDSLLQVLEEKHEPERKLKCR